MCRRHGHDFLRADPMGNAPRKPSTQCRRVTLNQQQLNHEPFQAIRKCTMTQKVIVLTGFAKLSDAEALATAGAVIKGIYVDKVFAAPPPFDEATLRTSVDDLTGSIATQAQAGGGTAVTTVKNKKRDVLDGLLRKLAHYVQANVSSLSSNSPFLLQPRRCCSTWTWRDWFAARPT